MADDSHQDDEKLPDDVAQKLCDDLDAHIRSLDEVDSKPPLHFRDTRLELDQIKEPQWSQQDQSDKDIHDLMHSELDYAESVLRDFGSEMQSLCPERRAPHKLRNTGLVAIQEDEPLDDRGEMNLQAQLVKSDREEVRDVMNGKEAREWQGWASQVNELLNDFHHKLAKLEWKVNDLSRLSKACSPLDSQKQPAAVTEQPGDSGFCTQGEVTVPKGLPMCAKSMQSMMSQHIRQIAALNDHVWENKQEGMRQGESSVDDAGVPPHCCQQPTSASRDLCDASLSHQTVEHQEHFAPDAANHEAREFVLEAVPLHDKQTNLLSSFEGCKVQELSQTPQLSPTSSTLLSPRDDLRGVEFPPHEISSEVTRLSQSSAAMCAENATTNAPVLKAFPSHQEAGRCEAASSSSRPTSSQSMSGGKPAHGSAESIPVSLGSSVRSIPSIASEGHTESAITSSPNSEVFAWRSSRPPTLPRVAAESSDTDGAYKEQIRAMRGQEQLAPAEALARLNSFLEETRARACRSTPGPARSGGAPSTNGSNDAASDRTSPDVMSRSAQSSSTSRHAASSEP